MCWGQVEKPCQGCTQRLTVFHVPTHPPLIIISSQVVGLLFGHCGAFPPCGAQLPTGETPAATGVLRAEFGHGGPHLRRTADSASKSLCGVIYYVWYLV